MFVLSVVLVGCTASDERSEPDADSAEATLITTEWEAPADPEAEGPTEAPPLEEAHAELDESIPLPTGMSVRLDSIETTAISPETPGEIAGSAVIVSVTLENTSEAAQNVDSAVVMVTTSDGEMGIATTAGPNSPLRGDVEPGAEATGSYVYMLEPAKGREVTISVNYAAGEPLALFSGTIP